MADGFVGVPGCHNACWFANPQDTQRGGDPRAGSEAANASYLEERFRPYVESIVEPLRDDRRVLFWEVYNEPCEWRWWQCCVCGSSCDCIWPAGRV